MSDTVSLLIEAAGGYRSLRPTSEIGRAFVEREGLASSTDQHARKIWSDLSLDPERVSAGRENLGNLLDRRIAADFTTGNVVDLHGWRLSRLEVDLAVLVYLVGR